METVYNCFPLFVLQAEINLFHEQRVVDFKGMMQGFLREQITFYQGVSVHSKCVYITLMRVTLIRVTLMRVAFPMQHDEFQAINVPIFLASKKRIVYIDYLCNSFSSLCKLALS